MFQSGYLSLGRWRGALIRLHWSIPLGALLFGGFRFDPVFLLGFVALVLVHEIGHALLVWRFRHSVTVIEATGFGGVCQWSGNATPFEECAIAWGGVLAQAVLAALAYTWLALVGPPASAEGWTLMQLATRANLWLIAINLMPMPPLDGAKAWRIFAHWRERGNPDVPYGSWRDPNSMSQRAWFESLLRASKRRRRTEKRERVPVHIDRDPLDPERELSPEAKQAIDDVLAKVRAQAAAKRDEN